jgi:hypothetical protein
MTTNKKQIKLQQNLTQLNTRAALGGRARFWKNYETGFIIFGTRMNSIRIYKGGKVI